MPGVGRLHLVTYGVSILGPRSTHGSRGYRGAPAPLCRPCLGDGACGQLEGGGRLCQVEFMEAYGGVQHSGEVVYQGLV